MCSRVATGAGSFQSLTLRIPGNPYCTLHTRRTTLYPSSLLTTNILCARRHSHLEAKQIEKTWPLEPTTTAGAYVRRMFA